MQKKWEKLVARTEDVLHWDACVSFRREGLKLGPIQWGTKSDLVLKNNDPLAVFYDSNPPIAEQTNLGGLIVEVNLELDQALDEAIEIIAKDLSAVPGNSYQDLEQLYWRFRTDMGLMIFGLVSNAIPIEQLEVTLGAEKFLAHKELILKPYKTTLIGRESKAIYSVQKQMAEQDTAWLSGQAESLAKEFGYIHSEYVSESWTDADYLRAFHGEVLAIEEEKVLDQTQFSEYEAWLVSVVQKLSYLHDEGKTALVRTNWALRETLKNLRQGDQILHLNEQEFLTWIQTKELPGSLSQRDNYYAILSRDHCYEFYYGQAAVEALAEEEGLTQQIVKQEHEIKGTVAFKGKVVGKVRIIFTQEDSKSLQEGEILVASMTTPAYIDAMRRAAAFVTDEGGALCHAAIVAREFKKPCVVGTKMATTNFVTGDMVEVDAEKGVVRILGEIEGL